MDDKLLEKYLAYASTDEAFAVLFVKKYLAQAKGHWIDIIDSKRYEMSNDNLHFRFVLGGLYKRKVRPQYPSKSKYTINGKFDEHSYYLMTRAITWETAHNDIEQQKLKNLPMTQFKITGVSYPKNRNGNGYFRDDAPPEIKALAKNLSDKTNPLWDRVMQYINDDEEYVYKIKNVSIL